MIEEMKLKQKGLYIAEDLTTHEQYLVNVEGKAPMLRVINAISISDFKHGATKVSNPNKIEDNVDNMTWAPLEVKIAIKPTKREAKIHLEDFKSLKANYDKYRQMLEDGKESEIATDICCNEDVSIEVALELVKQFKLSLK